MPREPDCRSPDQTADGVPSDGDLLEGIRRSSEADFNLLYERYFQRVYGFAYARLGNRADAEEVVQETFTAVFRSADTFREQSSLLSWIYGIARNTINNHLRRAKVDGMRLQRAELDLQHCWSSSLDSCTPEEHLNLRRGAEAINERLESLASWQAEVFVLRHVEDLPIDEIARRMSRSNDAVRSSLYRVKRLLVEAVNSEAAPAA